MIIGTLDALRRYPVKSLCGDELDAVDVDASGIPGDRANALFASDGARAGKAYRGKESDRLHLLSDVEQARADARSRGVAVELRLGQHFFDCAPISLLINTWLEDLSAHVGYRVQWERFRPNFLVRAANGAPSEEALIDQRLQLGSVRLRVLSPIERCVTITYHPEGEPSDPRILRFLAERRNTWMGVYCDVLEPGIARLGDLLIRQ
jgi:uncharacterized protein